MMKKVFLLIVSLFFAVNALAQTKVKGVVVDSSNQPLIGAGIVQVGNTTNGTVSDIDGSFSLNVPETASLQVSCVGYTTKIVNIEGRTQLTIILDENSELLNDVVVVAFGQMKKEAFTGSAGTMKSEELAKVQVTNAASALAGRVAGLQINNSSSQLGSSPSITIRGVSSISSGTEPLIVIDGMPFDGDLNLVNTNDIETMTVLKDAASNALYGARGANGVIMITTKRATSSDAKILSMPSGVLTKKGLGTTRPQMPGSSSRHIIICSTTPMLRRRGRQPSQPTGRPTRAFSIPVSVRAMCLTPCRPDRTSSLLVAE